MRGRRWPAGAKVQGRRERRPIRARIRSEFRPCGAAPDAAAGRRCRVAARPRGRLVGRQPIRGRRVLDSAGQISSSILIGPAHRIDFPFLVQTTKTKTTSRR